MPEASRASWYHRSPWWLKGILLAALPYITWMATYPRYTPQHRAIELGFLMLLQGLVVASIWLASRRPGLEPALATALRWMAGGWSVNLLATLALPFSALSKNGAFPVGLPDLGYLATYLFFFIGMFRMPRAEAPLPGATRILLDGAVFVVGVGAPLWLFTLRPALSHGLTFESFLAAAYPALAFLGVMALNLALLWSKPFPNRTAHHLLLVGTGVSWLADLIFSLQVDNADVVIGLRFWGNIINAVALILCLVGAWRIAHDPAPERPLRPIALSPVPMVTIVLVSLWLVRLVGKGLDGQKLQGVLFGILLLILVLLVRESLSLQESMLHGQKTATLAMQARFEALVRHSSDPILVTGTDGRILFSDPAAVRVTGLSTATLEGRALLGLLHPEDTGLGTSFLQSLIQNPETPQVQRVRMGPPEGPWRLLEISGCNLLSDPAVEGLVLNARDITERHRLEDQLQEAQKMEAVGRLAGGVAHDFNNLLSAIMGNLGLAEASLPEGHPARKDLARIQGAATRGAALTGRLLAFCRRDLPESKVVNPEYLLQGMLPLIKGLVGEQVRIDLDLASDAGAIAVDPNELEQAILNLAANARDAMPEGGTLTLRLLKTEPEGPPLTLFLPGPTDEYVILEVADNGQGMDEATQSHLFEPFFTTKARGRGTGLGLSSVYGMVKASHGGLEVGSILGRGTTVRLRFPRTESVPEGSSSGANDLLQQGTETILLVEDEPSVRETTQRILQACGYEVVAAEDAREARERLAFHAGRIHLLLTDVIMPGESGPALAADLVRHHTDLRVLYISGYTADELGPHGLARPDAPLLRKPFTIDQLHRRVREVLEGPPGLI